MKPVYATRGQVRQWMALNADHYESATQLAEGANCVFDLPQGAMDDESHWIWEEAAMIKEEEGAY